MEKNLTRSEVKANRLGWAKFLQEPERKKIKGILESPSNPEERCCLGHGCKYLNLERNVTNSRVYYEDTITIAPRSLVKSMGLYNYTGYIPYSFTYKGERYTSLANLNDYSDITPQEIGKLIEEKWIEGGSDTPFRPLSDYKELKKQQ